MYQQYFGLSEAPFSIAPDPRYLFLSNKHREALAHLIYGVGDKGGFVVLTGEVGTGKTTVCRCLLQQVPDNADIAFIINPRQSVNQLLQSIFNDLGVQYEKGITSKDLIDQLNHYLLDAHARGRNTIVIIDEAQNLTTDVLEQLRLLTNLETNEKKLLQLVLLGQPELNTLLARPELRQLSQRVTARYHLSPLSRSEVTEYIDHRLSVAGCRAELFTKSAIRKIYTLTQGVPRLINLICDRALLGVYATNHEQVTAAIVTNAAKEVFAQPLIVKPLRSWIPAAAAVCIGLLVFTVTYVWKNDLIGADSASDVASMDFNTLIEKNPPQAIHPTSSFQSTTKPPAESTSKSAIKSTTKPATTQRAAGWLQQLHSYDDPKAVLKQLYQMWRLNPDSSDVLACLDTAMPSVGVYCRQAVSTVSQLRMYNSPVVLSYKLDDERFGYLLVSHINEEVATVTMGEQQFLVPAEELFNDRFSHSYLLTRIPGNVELPIFPGDKGAAVGWLQRQIAKYGNNRADMKGTATIDNKIASGKNKLDFLYAHRLDFHNALISQHYNEPLQQQVTQLQEQLGMVKNAIVDIALLVTLNKSFNQLDPTLYPQPHSNGFHGNSFNDTSVHGGSSDTGSFDSSAQIQRSPSSSVSPTSALREG